MQPVPGFFHLPRARLCRQGAEIRGDSMQAGSHGSMDSKEKNSRNSSWLGRAGDYAGMNCAGASWGSWTRGGGMRCAINGKLQGWRSWNLAERRWVASTVWGVRDCSMYLWEKAGKKEACNKGLECADSWRRSEDLWLGRRSTRGDGGVMGGVENTAYHRSKLTRVI